MRPTKILKTICPMNVLFRMKYALSLFKQKEIKTVVDKNIYYLDAPDYGNLGDQAIALGIKRFADEYFSDYGFVEISYSELAAHISSLKKIIKDDDIIFLTGGGNMGNIYSIYEASRRFVIKNFPNNKIVVFPQTIDYTDDFFGKCSVKASQRIYSSHRNLILCAREKNSYNKMKKLYPSLKIVLCPDIVLLIDELHIDNHRNGIALCLRDDGEAALSEDNKKYITDFLEESKSNIKMVTTGASDDMRITYLNREDIVMKKLYEIAQHELMITDRLHGMIFAYITNTPCLAFANSNGKIKGVYEWIKDDGIVIFEPEKNKEINFKYAPKETSLNDKFEVIKNAIIGE